MRTTHPAHSSLLKEIRARSGKGTSHSNNDSYLSSGHVYHNISVPHRRFIAKQWLQKNTRLSSYEFLRVLDHLFKGKSHEEKTIACILLAYSEKHRKTVTVKRLDRWLNHLVGCAEIDSLCSNVFKAEEMLADWNRWRKFIAKLSKDKNINKRRASLVFLTNAVRQSSDPRLKKLAFEIVDRLKSEKPILITKAVSWVLRDLSYNHRRELIVYLTLNKDKLPKIALRETWRKIKTGRK